MSFSALVPVLCLLAQTPWQKSTETDGITVLSRQHPGSSLYEMRATGVIDAPPEAVWKVLRDYDHYAGNMPYTQESRVVARENGDKVIYFYSVVSAPMVSKRDYIIRIVDESDYKDGKGVLKTTWTATSKGPAPRDGIVRIPVNDGSWVLEPRDGGKRTFATYSVYSDPGGSLPKFIVNSSNGTATANVFKALRKGTKK